MKCEFCGKEIIEDEINIIKRVCEDCVYSLDELTNGKGDDDNE